MNDGHGQNPQVEPERPVLDVPEIVVDALLHVLKRAGFPEMAVDLGPARHSRRYSVAKLVAADHVAALAVER